MAAGVWMALCFFGSLPASAQIPQRPALADWGKQTGASEMETESREPLVSGPENGFLRGLLLDEVANLEGVIGELDYEKVNGKGTRFYMRKLAGQSVGHMWHFKPMDFRKRTFRIHYSGMAPERATFEFYRSETGRKFSREFVMEIGSATKVIEFAVPDEYPFRDVTNFAMRIKCADGERPFADFYIERIEVVKSDAEKTA